MWQHELLVGACHFKDAFSPCSRRFGVFFARGGGGGVLPYKGLMGTCGQPGYVFRDFCPEQGIECIIFCLNQGIDLSIFVFVLNRVGV